MSTGLLAQTYLSRHELAEHLGVSERTIQRWEREQKMPVQRWSARLVRYQLADVERWLRKRAA